MHYILDARTILQRVEVMMTYYYRTRIAPVQFLKQSSHGCLLSLCSRIFGLTSDIEPSLIADAYRVDIVVLAVGTCQPFRTARLYLSVPTDYSMSPLPPGSPPVPLLNSLVLTSLDSPFLMAIAFTVVVSLRVKPPSYRVLCAVGVEPSVV